MHLTKQQVISLDKASLIGFLSRCITEGHHIDYKQALSGESKNKQNTEFLKDTAGFANANGGHIIIGVKEPDDATAPEDLIVGVENGQDLAHSLERLASSGVIDPRITGLLVHPVPVGDGLWTIVVHIPPSMAKPHIVVYKKNTFLPQRHSESTQPMNSYDVRQAVLTAATAEDQAKHYAEQHRLRMIKTLDTGSPVFCFTATPLIPASSPLDVYGEPMTEVIKGSNRNSRYGDYYGLGSMPAARPTVEGVLGAHSYDQPPRWVTELHRSGFLAAVYHFEEFERAGGKPSGPYCINKCHHQLFKAFGDFCEDFTSTCDFDTPFVMDCALKNASGTVYGSTQAGCTTRCTRGEFVWPSAIKQPGEPFAAVMDDFITILLNAYGKR